MARCRGNRKITANQPIRRDSHAPGCGFEAPASLRFSPCSWRPSRPRGEPWNGPTSIRTWRSGTTGIPPPWCGSPFAIPTGSSRSPTRSTWTDVPRRSSPWTTMFPGRRTPRGSRFLSSDRWKSTAAARRSPSSDSNATTTARPAADGRPPPGFPGRSRERIEFRCPGGSATCAPWRSSTGRETSTGPRSPSFETTPGPPSPCRSTRP